VSLQDSDKFFAVEGGRRDRAIAAHILGLFAFTSSRFAFSTFLFSTSSVPHLLSLILMPIVIVGTLWPVYLSETNTYIGIGAGVAACLLLVFDSDVKAMAYDPFTRPVRSVLINYERISFLFHMCLIVERLDFFGCPLWCRFRFLVVLVALVDEFAHRPCSLDRGGHVPLRHRSVRRLHSRILDF